MFCGVARREYLRYKAKSGKTVFCVCVFSNNYDSTQKQIEELSS